MRVLLCLATSTAAGRTLSPYQAAYRMNYRANAQYAVDCTSTLDSACREYCAANTLSDPVVKPDLEDWLDSWPDGCQFNVNSSEVLNTERFGFLREIKSHYLKGTYMSHSFLLDVTSLQNNGLPSHLNSIEFKSVFAVSVTSGDVSHIKVGKIPAQFCLIEGIVDTHEGAHCIAPDTLTPHSRYSLIGGNINLSIWPNVKEWGDASYFVDEDTEYNPDDAGDRKRGLVSSQLIWSGTIPLSQKQMQTDNTPSKELRSASPASAAAEGRPDLARSSASSKMALASSAPFGQRHYAAGSGEVAGWSDFLNPVDRSPWLRAREATDIVDDTPVAGKTYTITVTIPLKEIAKQWSGTMQIIKSKLTLRSSLDFKVRTGSQAEITPWYDSDVADPDAAGSAEAQLADCADGLYTCNGVANLVRHDPWFARDTSAAFDVFYAARRRCARDPISCSGKAKANLVQESARNLTFYMPRQSLARSQIAR